MDTDKNRIAFKVTAAAERKIRSNHPWVFDQSIVKQSKDGESGDFAIIFDQKKNKFLAAGLYDPDSPIRIKLMQFGKGQAFDLAWAEDRIEKAFNKRQPLLRKKTNSYRFIFGENDRFPGLIVDIYAQVMVIKLYSNIWIPHFRHFIPILKRLARSEVVVLRLSRQLQSKKLNHGFKDGQILEGELDDPSVLFVEHGLKFRANVLSGHKTGYFLDHRHNRKLVSTMSKGLDVLDVFSYAGGFSVHALVGGARTVTSVDISKHALDLAEKNVKLNKKNIVGRHKILCGDAFEVLQKLIKGKMKYELVIIDPPSFAKSSKEIDSALRSYAKLAKLGIQLVAKKGSLVLASCSSRVDSESYYQMAENQLISSGRKWKLIRKTSHDVDHPIGFPEGAYLKTAYYFLK